MDDNQTDLAIKKSSNSRLLSFKRFLKLKLFAIVLLTFVILLVLSVMYLQNSFLYIPSIMSAQQMSNLAMSSLMIANSPPGSVTTTTSSSPPTIKSWNIKSGFYMDSQSLGKPTPATHPVKILVFHGNGGHAYNWMENIGPTLLKEMTPHVTGVYVFEYPGYGRKYDEPSVLQLNHKLIITQCSHALEQLLQEFPTHQILLIGISLGTGIACEVLAKLDHHKLSRIKGLVLITPYLNILKVLPTIIQPIASSILNDNYSCEEWLPKIENKQLPIVIVGGKYDGLIPFDSHVLPLYDLVQTKSLFQHVLCLSFNGDHNDAWVHADTWLKTLNEFLIMI